MIKNDYRDMTDRDLAGEIIGKRIVEIDADENTMTLHDGTVLEFQDVQECCAWFEAELKEKNLTDNAITHVTMSGEYGDAWSIHILAANTHIADVNITGDKGTGYYCHSIELEVTRPDN